MKIGKYYKHTYNKQIYKLEYINKYGCCFQWIKPILGKYAIQIHLDFKLVKSLMIEIPDVKAKLLYET